MSALPQPKDRRRGPRMNLDAAAIIRLDSVNNQVPSRIVNASRSGLLLAMPAPRPVGTRIYITVRIDDPLYEIQVAGIIVHVAEEQDAPAGFGTRVGIFLTKTGSDWASLCRRLGGE